MTAKTRTCFWFDKEGEEAAAHYVSLLPNSEIQDVFRPDPQAPALLVSFTLAGTPYQILNGGPQHRQSEAASICVLTEDQDETDRLWDALTANGGQESMCGWLKDRWGLSWQIVPKALPEILMAGGAGAARAFEALMAMRKIDIAAIEAAARSAESG